MTGKNTYRTRGKATICVYVCAVSSNFRTPFRRRLRRRRSCRQRRQRWRWRIEVSHNPAVTTRTSAARLCLPSEFPQMLHTPALRVRSHVGRALLYAHYKAEYGKLEGTLRGLDTDVCVWIMNSRNGRYGVWAGETKKRLLKDKSCCFNVLLVFECCISRKMCCSIETDVHSETRCFW